MPRKMHLPKTDLVKAVVYTAVGILLLLFCTSFLPATQWTTVTPNLLVAMISLLAYYEGAGYAGVFGVVFGALLPPLFYAAFALLCAWLYENFFVRNFFAWLCYTAAGLIIVGLYGLFYAVSAWDMALDTLLAGDALGTFLLSLVLSLPLYRFFGFLHRKTDLKLG